MILTDREIHVALEKELLRIDPKPDAQAFSSTSVDLTLDPILSKFKPPPSGLEQTIDLSQPGIDIEQMLDGLTDRMDLSAGEGHVLKPHRFVLAWTRESVDLPYHSRLAARVEGKSSLARLGLAIHMTAPTIHAGFKGRIRLEMTNNGHVPIRLRPGMRVCQLILEQTLGTPERGYQGRFFDQ